MPDFTPDRRTLRRTAGAAVAVSLLTLGAAPAVADGPGQDLVIGKLSAPSGVKPGTAFDVPVTFTNKGTEALGKVWVSFSMSQGLGRARTFSNCLYYDVPSFDEAPPWSGVHCKFDRAIEPGRTYALAQPLKVDALQNALYEGVGAELSVDDPFNSDWEGPLVPGDGPELELVEQPDADPVEGSGRTGTSMKVSVANTADFGVQAPRIRGRAGQTVDADVTFLNAGPAWVERQTSVGRVDVRFPAGTTVVSAQPRCDLKEPRHYVCGPSDAWINPQRKLTYDFRVKIDRFVAGAAGKATIVAAPWPFDKNRTNDTAEIVVENSAGNTTGGGSGSATGGSGGSSSGGSGTTGGSGSSSTGGAGSSSTGGAGSTASTGGTGTSATGGDLASTGSDSALPLAGAAAAAVAAGGGLVLVMRRRRARS